MMRDIYGLKDYDPAIFHVIRDGVFDALVRLLEEDPDQANAVMESFARPALTVAASRGEGEMCHLLLKYGAKLNAGNESGQNAFYTAVMAGHEELAFKLMELGANQNALVHGDHSLHKAVQTCSPKIVTHIVESGVDVDVERNNGSTPLVMATFAGRLDNVQTLIGLGAQVTSVGVKSFSGFENVLMIAAEKKPDVVRFFLSSYSWSQNVLDHALYRAVFSEDFVSGKLLFNAGADPQQRVGKRKTTSLNRAILKKYDSFVELFTS